MDVARVQQALGQRHLQGDFAAEQPVPRQNHEPEPPRPDVIEDLESAQQRLGVVSMADGSEPSQRAGLTFVKTYAQHVLRPEANLDGDGTTVFFKRIHGIVSGFRR